MQKITLTSLFGCRLTDGVKGLASDAEEVERGFGCCNGAGCRRICREPWRADQEVRGGPKDEEEDALRAAVIPVTNFYGVFLGLVASRLKIYVSISYEWTC
jgi:hypothetical protein